MADGAAMDLDKAPMADARAGLSVPVIDLSVPGATEAIARACADWGFFQIVGHGIAAGQIAQVMAATKAFFHRPKTEKRALSRSRENPWGFYDRELTKNARDKKEVFDIGPDVIDAQAPGDPFHGRTPWPADGSAFEAVMRDHLRACEAVSVRLMDAISRGLGAAPDRLNDGFRPSHTSFLRLNYYPVDDPLAGETQAEADLGIHHHTDAGALTVLLQDKVPGLQVYRDCAWYGVEPLDGAFVINIGDMMQVWSNDAYRAPVHRVLAMQAVERFSVPFFYNPAYDAVVAPIEAAVSDTNPARYAGFSWGEFRRRRADGDFADYGAEVQISDYRVP